MADTATTLAVITRFEAGFNTRDFDAIVADMTEDAVFEHVAPADQAVGRFEGRAALRAAFAAMDEHFPNYDLRATDIFANGDRAACQWEITWDQPDGTRAHARGADLFRMRGDKILEKLSYLTV